MTACRNCKRTDCPLLADSIIGDRAYVNALVNCVRAARERRTAPGEVRQPRGTVAQAGRKGR